MRPEGAREAWVGGGSRAPAGAHARYSSVPVVALVTLAAPPANFSLALRAACNSPMKLFSFQVEFGAGPSYKARVFHPPGLMPSLRHLAFCLTAAAALLGAGCKKANTNEIVIG